MNIIYTHNLLKFIVAGKRTLTNNGQTNDNHLSGYFYELHMDYMLHFNRNIFQSESIV